jgi:hypothetical protein
MDLARFPSLMAWMSSGARPFLESGTERRAEAASLLVSRLCHQATLGGPVLTREGTSSPTGVKVAHLSFSATHRVRSGRFSASLATGSGAIGRYSATSGFKAKATCGYAAPHVSRRPL